MPDALTAAEGEPVNARPRAPRPRFIPSMSAAQLFAAARALLPVLTAGRVLDAATLRDAMTRAFGATDAEGAWVWKDAYEAAEAAVVLFLQRYGRAMRRRAGVGGPPAMLAMLQKLAALEPSHTKRSEDQIRLQQFSTPLGLAYAALQAAAIRPGDVVLEPSAGTGILAVMAQCALGDRTAGALHLNEIAAVRAGLLSRLFPDATVTRHNAEAIADHLPGVRPAVVLMNPPFSASPGVTRIRHDADLRHLRSAFSMLPPGGRLVGITSAGCMPGDSHLDGRLRGSRSPGAHRVLHGHPRPGLCAARHHLRHPPDRDRSERGPRKCHDRSRGPGKQLRGTPGSRHSGRTRPPRHRQRRGASLRRPGPRPLRQHSPGQGERAQDHSQGRRPASRRQGPPARLGVRVRARIRHGPGLR